MAVAVTAQQTAAATVQQTAAAAQQEATAAVQRNTNGGAEKHQRQRRTETPTANGKRQRFHLRGGSDTMLAFKEYCEAMTELSLKVSELLAISLGLERMSFRRFFEDSSSIMRCNYYPACEKPELTLGTGPHCDPTSLTILHQDHVGGLEVFADGKWHLVSPKPAALVVNIGDTFMALTNGKYKSCLHRAVVKKESERRSLAFFLCPNKEKTVRPPEELLRRDGWRR
ncbi:Sexual differentiation process protein, partial [Nymphaea thermarum]